MSKKSTLAIAAIVGISSFLIGSLIAAQIALATPSATCIGTCLKGAAKQNFGELSKFTTAGKPNSPANCEHGLKFNPNSQKESKNQHIESLCG